ncbi:alpha/beta hydrolase [Roseicyclus sp. F158]|uniref:Alpha/beta hydrolase n=1 Tax=Tropicimonas omnivorans TaxID=3075590 RepID=A0ABU3DD20_9RHOB|nr:alpha/beta hydrolase [Roseicyclus sp. F158]MDT0681610.1 alpha/beta hydrolase [Roseicyclus sp. F158]
MNNFKKLPAQSSINEKADAYGEVALETSEAAADTVRLAYDIPFGDDPAQAIDVYAPKEGGTGLPVLVFFHGGNFTHGFKEWCGFMAPAITAFPAILVSASYRLSPEVSFRDLLRDCFAAVKKAQEVAPDFGGDPERLFVGGHSAGGQIAALLVQRDDWRDEAGLPADAIKGSFPMSANFARRLTDLETDTSLHIGPEVPDSPLELARSPLPRDIPVLVAWGGDEKPYVLEEGPQFVEALKASGVRAEGMVMEGADHFEAHLRTGDPDDPWTRRVRQIMAR